MDLDAIALCWVEAEPFRTRRLVSSDAATQSAIEALLSGGYRRLYEAVGPRNVGAIIERAAFAETLNPRSLPALKPAAPRAPLAPLEPDAFLRWTWEHLPEPDRGPDPLTVEDVWFALGIAELSITQLRQDYVRIAARVRRNQRLGLDPWTDVGVWTGWRR